MLFSARVEEALTTFRLSLYILRDYSQGSLNPSLQYPKMVSGVSTASVPVGPAVLIQSSSFQNPF